MTEATKTAQDFQGPKLYYHEDIGNYRAETKYPRELILERIQEIGENIIEDNINTEKKITLIEIGLGAQEFFKHLYQYLEENSNLDIDRMYIPAKSYVGKEQGGIEIGDYELPEEGLTDGISILVDCVCDGKGTLREVSREISQYQPSRQDAAILFLKSHEEVIDSSMFQNEYIGFLAEPEDWLIGFSVDFKNQGREEPDMCVMVLENE